MSNRESLDWAFTRNPYNDRAYDKWSASGNGFEFVIFGYGSKPRSAAVWYDGEAVAHGPRGTLAEAKAWAESFDYAAYLRGQIVGAVTAVARARDGLERAESRLADLQARLDRA